jgi:hypothetical protein
MTYIATIALDDRFNPGSLAAHTIAELGDVWGADIPPARWADPQTQQYALPARSHAEAEKLARQLPAVLVGLATIQSISAVALAA